MAPDYDTKIVTVRDLIAALQKQDPDALLEVPLQTYTQRYPSAYRPITWIEKAHDGRVRLWVHLGKGFVISERKSK